MKSFSLAKRLKVDEDDITLDFLRYYKSKDFDAKVPIYVKFQNQPGVDSGGLLRQAFCTVFEALAKNEVAGLKLFTGSPNRLTPVYSSENLLTYLRPWGAWLPIV